jgi:Nucleotidyl transferase AbiEii toxin, Type IV TA system
VAERDGGREGYSDWRSLELAIKDAAKKAAGQAGPGISAASVDAQVRQARFDRFLCRVFADGEQSEWLLKGGMSMLARVRRSRTTKDVDLAALRAPDLAEAARALAVLAEADLGDHLAFRLTRSTPTGLGENQPGVATRRYSFACFDADHDTQVDTIVVDVVVGPPPVGSPEVAEPANRLHLRRPLVTFPYRLYPVADQVADKVCATMDTQYPGGKRSSRVKDLVDLILIACTQAVDLDELRAAIAAKRDFSRIGPFEHFDVPAEWARTYPATAKGVPAAEPFSAQAAANLVASFIDPALGKRTDRAAWDPQALAWIPVKSDPATGSTDT